MTLGCAEKCWQCAEMVLVLGKKHIGAEVVQKMHTKMSLGERKMGVEAEKKRAKGECKSQRVDLGYVCALNFPISTIPKPNITSLERPI